jgi:O-antigen/teichoic acid export membrane protein
MPTFNTALRGTSWALVAQVVIGVGQLAYSGLTARIFRPDAFGEFAAALSLHGLMVLYAAGLSSFVLKEQQLQRTQIRALNLVAFSVALLGAVVFWFVSPLWLAWLNSPGGTQFVPLLTCATFVAPIGAVQSVLMRREGDGRADAVVYTVAFIVATGLGAVCAILLREPWTLAIGPAVNPMILMALSRVLRRAVYPISHKRFSFDWLAFALRVVGQNSVFFGLAQVPTWAMGASTDPATLGQFSRGGTLAFMPANAFNAAMLRGTAAHWRKIETRESSIRGVTEALVLAATVSFAGFAALAVLSRPVISLWLGPGWGLAAEFTAWLAIGFALQIPTTLLANYLEMTEALSRVYRIQFANAVGLALGVALLVSLHNFRFLLAGIVLSHFLGLLTAAFQVSAALEIHACQLLKQLIAPLISATGVGCAAYGAAALVATGIGPVTGMGNAAQLCAAAFATFFLVFLTRKWQPAFSILTARGVLKRSES